MHFKCTLIRSKGLWAALQQLWREHTATSMVPLGRASHPSITVYLKIIHLGRCKPCKTLSHHSRLLSTSDSSHKCPRTRKASLNKEGEERKCPSSVSDNCLAKPTSFPSSQSLKRVAKSFSSPSFLNSIYRAPPFKLTTWTLSWLQERNQVNVRAVLRS